jgi:4-amino-4-deoxy-L-arabinose transferase-like glycosyltransferase
MVSLFCCAILLFCFAQTAWHGCRGKSATADESPALVASWVLVHDGDFRVEPEDPPLFRYYVAAGTRAQDMPRDHESRLWKVLLSDPFALFNFTWNTLYRTAGTDADALLAAARMRMILLGILLGALIAWWSWRLAGPLAAVVALAMFCFDPNFLAHTPLIKSDVATALLFLSLMMSVWFLGERATARRMITTALLLGTLIMTKTTGILGIPILMVALLCRACGPAEWRILRWTTRTRLARVFAASAIVAGAMLVVYVVMWSSYSFRYGPAPDPAQRFDPQSVLDAACKNQFITEHGGQEPTSQQWVSWESHWRPPLHVQWLLWANQSHLLPQAWVQGFLFLYAVSFQRVAFLCGQLSSIGWWYYFPLAMLFKTPLATLAGFCIIVSIWFWQRPGAVGQNWWLLCCMGVVPVFYTAAVMAARQNLGLRYILPVYPYLFIAMGVTAAIMWRRRPRTTAAVVALLLAGLATETYCASPNFIPFFNVACGGARGGLKLLSDSNLDWGQDLPLVAQWQRQHPDDTLYLLYFGSADPAYYGIQHYTVGGFATRPPTVARGKRAVEAISATVLQGTYSSEQKRRQLQRFTQQQPLAVLGGSIYLFEVQ